MVSKNYFWVAVSKALHNLGLGAVYEEAHLRTGLRIDAGAVIRLGTKQRQRVAVGDLTSGKLPPHEREPLLFHSRLQVSAGVAVGNPTPGKLKPYEGEPLLFHSGLQVPGGVAVGDPTSVKLKPHEGEPLLFHSGLQVSGAIGS